MGYEKDWVVTRGTYSELKQFFDYLQWQGSSIEVQTFD